MGCRDGMLARIRHERGRGEKERGEERKGELSNRQ